MNNKNYIKKRYPKTSNIISIICPNCKNKYLYLKKENTREMGIWKCCSCVYIWDENWFDIFHQFEKFIQRI